jgi:hypothetical protein
MTPRTLLALVCLALAAPGCSHKPNGLTVPASSDPNGKDMVEGAILAAVEKGSGVRLYKIVHVDDYPNPIGWEFHMIAYEPKGATFEEAAKLWETKAVKIAMSHVWVRWVNFKERDHRILGVEPVTESERATWARNKGIHSASPVAPTLAPPDSSQTPPTAP